MIDFLNNTGNSWLSFFLTFQVQNTLFIVLALALLAVFKDTRAYFKRLLTLIALVKTLIPPVVVLPTFGALTNSELIPTYILSTPIESVGSKAVTEGGLHFSAILFLLWILGGTLILFLACYYSFRLRLVVRKAEELTPYRKYRFTQMRIYVDENVKSPLVFGCFAPKVLLPKSWKRFDKSLQQSVLVHEYCHVKNGDLWFNGLKLLSLMIHFINPFQWILLHYFEVFSEMTCDDSAIEESRLSRYDYNALILKAAESLTLPNFLSGTWALSRAFKLLEARIKYQLNQKEEKEMKHSLLVRIAVLSVLFFAIVPFSWQCSNLEQPKESKISLAPEKSDLPDIMDENGVYAFFAVDKKPKLLEKARPAYPEEARKKGVEGIVVIVVTIDENGNVAEAIPLEKAPVIDDKGRIIETRPVNRISELEQAAIAAAKKCIFEPAYKDGKAVKVRMTIPYHFRLN